MIRHLLAAALLTALPGGADALPPAVDAGIPAPTAWAVVDGGDVTADGAHGADPDTPFLLGSLAKPLTAAVVLQLAEAGALDLADPVAEHLPGFRDGDADPVTILDLLTHRSGFTTADGLDATHDPSLDLDGRVAVAERAARSSTGFAYSNLNYALATAVVEAVTERPYADHLDAALLRPLGMRDTTADPAVAREVARSGHLVVLGTTVPFTASTPAAGGGDGHVVSTAVDVARFLRLLLDGGATPDGTRVLSSAGVDLLLAAHVAAPGAGAPGTEGYGLGWGVGTTPAGSRFAAHVGSTATFNTAAAVLPDEGRAVVVLTAANGWLYDTGAPFRSALAALDGSPAGATESAAVTATLLGAFAVVVLGAVAAVSALRRRRDRRRPPPPRVRTVRAALDATAAAAIPVLWFAGAGVAFTGRPFPPELALSASSELTALALVGAAVLAARAVAGVVRRPARRDAGSGPGAARA